MNSKRKKYPSERKISVIDELRDYYSNIYESFRSDIADDIIMDQLLRDCGALVRLKEKAKKLLEK